MVLFLFVVMLLNAPQEDAAELGPHAPLRQPGVGALRRVAGRAARRAAGLGADARRDIERRWRAQRRRGRQLGARASGRALFTDYAFAFEATSMLILVAMVGAVVLARREEASMP